MYTGQAQSSSPSSGESSRILLTSSHPKINLLTQKVLRVRKPTLSTSSPDPATPYSYSHAGILRSDSPLYRSNSVGPGGKGKGRETDSNSGPADFMLLDMGGPGEQGTGQSQEGYMQQQLVEGQVGHHPFWPSALANE